MEQSLESHAKKNNSIGYGHWIDHIGYEECSHCHNLVAFGLNYCPKCGIEMTEEIK